MRNIHALVLSIAAASLALTLQGEGPELHQQTSAPISVEEVFPDELAEEGSEQSTQAAEEQVPEQVSSADDAFDKEFAVDNDEFQKMIAQLQEHMKKLQESPEVKALEKELEALGLKLNTLSLELDEMKQAKVTYKSEVKELRARVAALEQDKAELLKKIETLTDAPEHASAEESAERLLEMKQKQADLSALEGHISAAQKELEEKRHQKKTVKEKIKSHELEMETVQTAMDEKAAQDDFDFSSFFGDEAVDPFAQESVDAPVDAVVAQAEESADELEPADAVEQGTEA